MFCVNLKRVAPNIIIEDHYVHEFVEFELAYNYCHIGARLDWFAVVVKNSL